MKMKSQKLTTIIASAILAVAPLVSGCQSAKVPVYGPADLNGNRKVIGHYRSTNFSTGINIDTYNQKEKEKYTPDSQN